MPDHPRECIAAGCTTSPKSRLPEELRFLGLSLCPTHIEYLLEVRWSAVEVADQQELESSYVDHVVLQEARALAYPVRELPCLRILKGGADENEADNTGRGG
jgi:hypothetical protein